MKKNFKQIFATLCVATMVSGMAPTDVLAADTSAADASVTSDDFELCEQVTLSAESLFLSTDSVDGVPGEYYEVQVLPADFALPLSWKISEVVLSNASAQVVEVVPEGTEVISTTSRMMEEDPTPEDKKLAFVIQFLRPGRVEFQVTVVNPLLTSEVTLGCKQLSVSGNAVVTEFEQIEETATDVEAEDERTYGETE